MCFPPISWEAHKLLGHGAAFSTALQRNNLPELSLLTNLNEFRIINIFENQIDVFLVFINLGGRSFGGYLSRGAGFQESSHLIFLGDME